MSNRLSDLALDQLFREAARAAAGPIDRCTQVESPDNVIYLDDARMTPLWEALTALDVPLYLHPHASYKAVMYEKPPGAYRRGLGFRP